jgi:hypothetical protein
VVLGLVQQRLAAWLAERGLRQGVHVQVEVVDAIARDPRSHKVRQILSQVPALGLDDDAPSPPPGPAEHRSSP